MPTSATALLRALFDAAVAAAQPSVCLPPHLPTPPLGRTLVIGAGKASAAMAHALERHWPGPLDGLVVTRYGYAVACEHIEIIEAAHPVPDAAGERAAQRILERVQGLTADDLVICLMSGGGSALLSLPAPGLTLADKQAINKALLKSGANITEMNCVRKHLSAIKGGRLAAACAPARVVSLLISDVPGDDPAVIASGPTVVDPTTFADALAILEKYRIEEPRSVLEHLKRGSDETPKPNDTRLARAETRMIATPQFSLTAAAEVARQAGYTPLILGDSLEGEAREVALMHAGIAKQVVRHGQPAAAPCVLLSGGETTVTVRGQGRGGRNAEFALALAVALEGVPGVYAIACDTDGIDGTEDNAGCLVTPATLARAEAQGLNAKKSLANNDGYGFFAALNDLVVSGPTLTNVNDFRAILIETKRALTNCEGKVQNAIVVDSDSVGEPAQYRTLADLERMLKSFPSAPEVKGRVALVVRRGTGGRREILDRIVLTPELGVPGDAWGRHAQPPGEMQIAVMQRDVAELIANGQPLTLFGDNLFLELDLSTASLPPGSRVRVGGALLAVTPMPHNGCQKFRARFGDGALRFVSKRELRRRNLRGIYMCVVESGEVSAGDSVEVISRSLAP